MTADPLALDDWLRQLEVVTVGLESTGIYWRPVYQLLEAGRTIVKSGWICQENIGWKVR
jgi:hypothetical protein